MNQLLAGIEIIKSLGNGAEKRSVLNRVSIEIGEGEFVSVSYTHLDVYKRQM